MVLKRVLVIDDSATVRQQVAQALIPGGFEVLEAVDGVDGFDKISASQDLCAVLCDVNMPRMSGLEMLERLRGAGIHPNLPIFMLTTEGQPSLMQRAKKAGAKGWIVKPFVPALLVATIKKVAS